MAGIKLSNINSATFGRLYAKTPKSVFAAVAYWYASKDRGGPEMIVEFFRKEWTLLYENGIVPQKPPGEKEH